MSILNTAICSSSYGNTGASDCPIDIKLIQFLIAVPESFVLSDAQLASPATALAALQAAIVNDLAALRAFPYPAQVTFTDNSTDPAFQAFGSGSSAPANDGMYDWMFQFTRGGLCLSNKLRKFNGRVGQRFFVIDAQGVLYGTRVGDTLKGIPSNYIYTDKFKAATYTEVAIYAYRVNFMPQYINENVGFIKLGSAELSALTGLRDIALKLAIPRVTNVIVVKALTGCDGTDMYDQYATELANVGNFRVTENGADITITSVAANANLKGFTLTLSASDPDYNAAGPFVVSLAPVSVLTAAGIVGYEGLPLTVA